MSELDQPVQAVPDMDPKQLGRGVLRLIVSLGRPIEAALDEDDWTPDDAA